LLSHHAEEMNENILTTCFLLERKIVLIFAKENCKLLLRLKLQKKIFENEEFFNKVFFFIPFIKF
jgi:hypothetical protein